MSNQYPTIESAKNWSIYEDNQYQYAVFMSRVVVLSEKKQLTDREANDLAYVKHSAARCLESNRCLASILGIDPITAESLTPSISAKPVPGYSFADERQSPLASTLESKSKPQEQYIHELISRETNLYHGTFTGIVDDRESHFMSDHEMAVRLHTQWA